MLTFKWNETIMSCTRNILQLWTHKSLCMSNWACTQPRFIGQNRQQIGTMQSKKHHCHRRCNFCPFFPWWSRDLCFYFLLWFHRFPDCFFYVPRNLVRNARDAVYLWRPRLICSKHAHTFYVAVYSAVAALIHLLFKSVNSSNSEHLLSLWQLSAY